MYTAPLKDAEVAINDGLRSVVNSLTHCCASAVQRIYLASDFFAQIDFSAVMYLLCFALIYGTW